MQTIKYLKYYKMDFLDFQNQQHIYVPEFTEKRNPFPIAFFEEFEIQSKHFWEIAFLLTLFIIYSITIRGEITRVESSPLKSNKSN